MSETGKFLGYMEISGKPAMLCKMDDGKYVAAVNPKPILDKRETKEVTIDFNCKPVQNGLIDKVAGIMMKNIGGNKDE